MLNFAIKFDKYSIKTYKHKSKLIHKQKERNRETGQYTPLISLKNLAAVVWVISTASNMSELFKYQHSTKITLSTLTFHLV